MTDSERKRQTAPSFAEKIFGINPYSKDDPSHSIWESNARLAAEEEAIFERELIKRNPKTPEEYGRYAQDGIIGHFDILAKRIAVVRFRSAESIALYEDCLAQMAESMLARAADHCPISIPKTPFLFELHRQFRQRIAHWMAEALKSMRDDGLAADRDSQTAAPRSKQNDRTSFVMRILSQQGWSVLDLANHAGVDFHTAQDYLSGKTTKPYASTLMKLANVLGVKVEDLPK